MFDITLITMGKLKEKFYISAAEEYKKRLGGYCKFTLLELPEVRLPENPSPAEISAGLEKEAELIFAKIPKGAWFCVFTPEGKELSSEGFASPVSHWLTAPCVTPMPWASSICETLRSFRILLRLVMVSPPVIFMTCSNININHITCQYLL